MTERELARKKLELDMLLVNGLLPHALSLREELLCAFAALASVALLIGGMFYFFNGFGISV